MKRRPLNLKPRNPTVVILKVKRGGAHGKPPKAIRRQEKQALAKEAMKSEEG